MSCEYYPSLLTVLRRRKGLTQVDLAIKAGCNQSEISILETGRSEALSEAAVTSLCERISKALDYDGEPKNLVGGFGE